MANRKSQFTLFLLLGIIILIGTALVFYANHDRKPLLEQTEQLPSHIQPFLSTVESCLTEELKAGVQLVAMQGGVSPSIDFVELGKYRIPYYIQDGYDKSPSSHDIELAISDYVQSGIRDCLDDFQQMGTVHLSDEQQVLVNITILESRVHATSKIPLEFDFNGIKVRHELFKAEIDSNLQKLVLASKEIVSSQLADPNYIPLDFLVDLGRQMNVTIGLSERQDTIIYSVIDMAPQRIDDNSYFSAKLSDDRLIFSFAVGYGWENTNEK